MNVDDVNRCLSEGRIDVLGVFPRLDALGGRKLVFRTEFGLDELPDQPGLLLVRGARQYGKSTWLEGQLRKTIETHGAGSGFFLDGDHCRDADDLSRRISDVASMFRKDASVRRLFIDEITAVDNWESAIKRPLDRGELAKVLVVTTGSRASDLRRGSERLPGRKGRLDRTHWLFTPISYGEFLRATGKRHSQQTLIGYLLTGGSPVACTEMAQTGRLPHWTLETVRDWILGECARADRPRRSLVSVMEQIHRGGGSPIGQTKLAKEAGLANNTVAAGYVELLADLQVLGISGAWDADRSLEIARKPAKFPFVNLLAAVAWSEASPYSVEEFLAMPPQRQGVWMEWLIAQELYRRAAIRGKDEPERLPYWQGGDHEIDFAGRDEWIEVKRGKTSPVEFAWFARSFPKRHLTVVGDSTWETDHVRAIRFEHFLLEKI
ncbi:MAG: ATP-binding protein [Fibrobacteres bacterium]|nr:ATP-binding protein [Fibrobacterota bacterium]